MSDNRAYRIATVDKLIGVINRGDECAEAMKLMRELVDRIAEVQAEHRGVVKGALTITLSFACDERGVDVTMATTAKMPKKPALKDRMFVDQNGGLTLQDPALNSLFPGSDLGRNRPAVIDGTGM